MIYVAAPHFSLGEREFIDSVVYDISRELNLDPDKDFYISYRDNISVFDGMIYDKNIKYLNTCDIMVAILDGQDVNSGTAFEIGFFKAQDKPVLGLLTDSQSYDEAGDLNEKLNTMIYGSLDYGSDVFSNLYYFIDELYDILIEE